VKSLIVGSEETSMEVLVPIIIISALVLGFYVLGRPGEDSASSAGRVAFSPDQIDGAAFRDERIQEALDKGN
jgi:hypothetical protein